MLHSVILCCHELTSEALEEYENLCEEYNKDWADSLMDWEKHSNNSLITKKINELCEKAGY